MIITGATIELSPRGGENVRQINLKYGGECAKCGNSLEVGSSAMHEKSMGIFCCGCEPTDIEDIRHYRTIKADAKAERIEDRARARLRHAGDIQNSLPEYRHDWAYITQPGYIPGRAKIAQKEEKIYHLHNEAEHLQERADNIRKYKTVVAGDAERRRQRQREALDAILGKGSRVNDVVFGEGVIVSVHKKSYRIKFDHSGNTYARDKSYVRPLPEQVTKSIGG